MFCRQKRKENKMFIIISFVMESTEAKLISAKNNFFLRCDRTNC